MHFPGSYQPSSGEMNCLPCPEGKLCAGNTSVPEPCPPFSYCPEATTAAVLCPNGTYTENSTTGLGNPTECAQCPTGEYSVGGVVWWGEYCGGGLRIVWGGSIVVGGCV